MSTVAGIIIGDEILSGKVADENSHLLVELCRETGATLDRIVFIGDEVADIADEVVRASKRCDVVITSGGVGPTHDDRTVEAVAKAFDVPVVRMPELEALIRELWGDRFTDSALNMANAPEGSVLLHQGRGLLPLVACRNVYLLPGVPRLFATMLPWIRRELSGPSLALTSIFLNSYESQVTPQLSQVDAAHPEVKIGSYPRLWAGDHRLWITLESHDRNALGAATRELLGLLPDGDIVRVEESRPAELNDSD